MINNGNIKKANQFKEWRENHQHRLLNIETQFQLKVKKSENFISKKKPKIISNKS